MQMDYSDSDYLCLLRFQHSLMQ